MSGPTDDAGTTPGNRRLVASLALLSGAVGMVPIPLVGDLAIDVIRAGLFRQLASRHGLRLEGRAALILCGAERPELYRTALAGLLTLLARVLQRHLARFFLVALRFEDMARTYVLGSLFDHYCRTHRPTGSVDEREAVRLRRVLVSAERQARIALLSDSFRRATQELIRAGTYLPRKLVGLLLALLRGRSEEVEREVSPEEDREGLFGRMLQRLESEMKSAEQGLLRAFDETWAAEQADAGR